jgi:SulP family sulfate permease
VRRESVSEVPFFTGYRLPPFASALRACLAEGYGAARFRVDLMAGAVVGVVALPLSMALAIASGVAPQYGLYTAIVAGLITAAAGGSRVQVTGPTAAFVVLLTPISATYGVGGLLVATVMAGLILLFLAFARLGRLISFVPYPVTTGFTAGIAVVLATLQLRFLLGLTVGHMPESYLGRLGALIAALPTARAGDVAIAAFTLAILVTWPRVTRRVPAPLVALTAATLVAFALSHAIDGFAVKTIATEYGGIPAAPPLPILPWNMPGPGPDGAPVGLSWHMLRVLASSAFAIAMLGAIESLLCAVVADGMTSSKHDPDGELLALGAANVVAPFFGGFAATGALARTATNVRSGATSPVSSIIHSVFVLITMLALAPLLSYLPMAALAALLVIVAWNMSEARHFVHAVRVSPKSDVAVLLACFGLTVIFDMVVSVTVGVMLAALLFMRRMAEVAGVRLLGEHHEAGERLPPGVLLYEIAGPLFFGAAQKAMSVLGAVTAGTRVVILDMRPVPVMDATGLVNLESVLKRLHAKGIAVAFVGVQPQPRRVLDRAGLAGSANLRYFRTVEEARVFASPPEPATSSA